MTDLRYCLAVARRMSVLEWAHGLMGGAMLTALVILAFGGAA